MGHVWIFQPDNNPNTNLKNTTKMGHWTQHLAAAIAIPVLWPEPCRRWVSELKKHRHGSVNLKGLEWFWMKEWSLISRQVFSDLNPVEDEWDELKKHRHGSVNLKGLEWFWMKEWSLISRQVFSDLNPVEDEWDELKKHRHGSVNLKGLEWFWMKEWSLISRQVFSDLNPVEDEWDELKKHRHGSVNLKGLEWFWMKECLWSLIRCSRTSSGVIGEHLELLNWQMEVSKSIE